jgi:alpha-ribazole phosphatase
MTLLLIRHGATHLNETHRFQGWSDPPLSPKGRRSMEAMVSTLPPLSPDVPVHVSDLRRARETARILFPHVAHRVDARLRELHFGQFEEWTAEEAAAREPAAWARWMDDPTEAPPPEGESLRDFQARVREWFEAELTPGEAAVVVAHGGTLGFLLELLNVDRAVPAPGEAVELSPNETNP